MRLLAVIALLVFLALVVWVAWAAATRLGASWRRRPQRWRSIERVASGPAGDAIVFEARRGTQKIDLGLEVSSRDEDFASRILDARAEAEHRIAVMNSDGPKGGD